MSLRTGLIVAWIAGVIVSSGCATKAMREQAGVLAVAGERLEAETAAFTAARTAVVQLRQRSLIQRKQEVAEQGQYNARTVAQWKVAGTEDRARRLALFEGVVAGSEAMYEVRDQGLLWEESVLYSRSALAIDRAALHRFVRSLVNLARPGRFIDEVKFYAEYGTQVEAQVEAGLADVKAGLTAAQDASGPPAAVTPIDGGGGTTPTPTDKPDAPGTITDKPTPPGPPRPETVRPDPPARDPSVPPNP